MLSVWNDLAQRRMNGQIPAICVGAIVGVFSAFINVLVITVFQTAVRPELRGRVIALAIEGHET